MALASPKVHPGTNPNPDSLGPLTVQPRPPNLRPCW
ncbi:predicted protein [Plenodomus lingam JN3]|uniref:Predicted protein n=1 Tax=Leptosphaeria maculans (strain JN3 / isolate v23.1.3 / race Av1-4-5-6-7-8) TaxID=985895 RepID=E4ZLL9_LEPMJ|nr:predicted protein [Plenodomus lingam JN3]CBX92699.1 predicted protein [Plenodomus lingam JN3]